MTDNVDPNQSAPQSDLDLHSLSVLSLHILRFFGRQHFKHYAKCSEKEIF